MNSNYSPSSAVVGDTLNRRSPTAPKARYAAFISYSHSDEELGDWLHTRLERYQVPPPLAGRKFSVGVIGKRIGKVFRDRVELSAAHDLATEIRKALEASDALIILCSPRAAQSRYVNEEIRYFKQLGKAHRVFAAILSGEPHALGKPGRTAEEECFPPALVYGLDPSGAISNIAEPHEPIAADFRVGKDGRENGSLKLIAGLLDLMLDELIQREQQAERRRRRRTAAVAATMSLLAIIASGAGLFAWTQREFAVQREQLARQELMRSMTNQGRLNVRSDPAQAVQLALAAFDIWPDPGPISVLHDAVLEDPPVARLAPNRAGAPRMALTVPRTNGSEVFAVDPHVTMALVREDEDRSAFVKSSDHVEISLRAVPGGAILGKLQLGPLEHFITPPEPTTNLFSTIGPNGIKVYRLSAKEFATPVADAKDAIDVAFTAGDFPIHFLKRGGTISSIDQERSDERVTAFDYQSGERIFAHPGGSEVIVLGKSELLPVRIDKAGIGVPGPVVSLDLGPTDPDPSYSWLHPMNKIAWGPKATQLLLADTRNKRTIVLGIDLDRGRSQTILSLPYSQTGLNSWFFAANGEGTRIALPEATEPGKLGTRIVEIDWTNVPSEKIAEARLPQAGLLYGAESGGKRSFPIDAAFAPSGGYLITAHYLKSLDQHSTAVNGVGVLQSWDLALLSNSNRREEQTCDALHVSDGASVGDTILQPEPIFEIRSQEPEALGTAPLLRVTYARDAKRVVALDDRGVNHIFQVRVSHGFSRAPEEWTDRLCPPDIRYLGEGGRFVSAKYGDGESIIFDRMQKRKVHLRLDGKVVTVFSGSAERIFVLTDREIAVSEASQVTNVQTLPIAIDAAFTGDEDVLAYGPDGALVIERQTGKLRGVVRGAEADRFLSALRSHVKIDNVVDLSFAPPRRYADGSLVTVITDEADQSQVWRLTSPRLLEFAPERVGSPIHLGLNEKERDWLSARRVPEPDTLIVNQGSYDPDQTFVRQIDTMTGQEVERFLAPAQGWPIRTYEIVNTVTNKDSVYILIRHVPKVMGGGNAYAVGRWDKAGGACLEWRELGYFDQNPLYVFLDPRTGTPHAMFSSDNEHGRFALVDLHSGRQVWEGSTLDRAIIAPFAVLKGDEWSGEQDDFYRTTLLELAIRGRAYWSELTAIQLPADQRDRIGRITGSANQNKKDR